jgi:hypothetical protein
VSDLPCANPPSRSAWRRRKRRRWRRRRRKELRLRDR